MVTRINFEQSLVDLQREILLMGGYVEKAIENSIKALKEQDFDLAKKVIEEDDIIDKMTLDIEDKILKLIATQQPMAKDLRRIATGFKLINDLERIGDNAVSIAKVVLRIGKEPLIKPLVDIPLMAKTVQNMVRDSLDSYVNEDTDLAMNLAETDDEVDHYHNQIFRELITYMLEDPKNISQFAQLLFVSRYLERIADHATNIGEAVIYQVTGSRKKLNM